ncbi:hypothetical protein ACS0TY_003162 [Phlomoides rotata]
MKEKDAKVDEYMKFNSNQIKNMEAQVTQMSQQQRATNFQLGQLATMVGSMQNKGKFPSTTEPNPKEHCKAIKLRSGTKYQRPQLPSEDDVEEKTAEVEQEKVKDEVGEIEEDEEIEPNQEDEEEKGLMKKKGKEVESSHRVPKWKIAKGLKEKASDDIECDEWGIPKVPDRIPFPRSVFLLVERVGDFCYLEENDGRGAYGWCAKVLGKDDGVYKKRYHTRPQT